MRNYRIGSIWDIPIQINVSLLIFLPVLAWIIGSGTQIDTYARLVEQLSGVALDIARLKAGNTPWVIGGAAAIGLFVSVAIHELGHAWAAMRYGIRTESITLWLLGGLASLESMPKEWDRELSIALAGPTTSVLVAVVAYVVVQTLPATQQVLVFVFGWLAVTNLVLAVFNLLPAFPMDGGRILRALLARSRSYLWATRTAARIGSLFAILFAIVGIVWFSPMLILLALFVYSAATSESRTVALDHLLEGLTIRDLMSSTEQTVSSDDTVADLGDQMLRERRTHFPVVDDGEVVGIVALQDFRKVKKGQRETMTVDEIMTRDLPRVGADVDAFDALVVLSEQRAGAALVEADGNVVGIVTQADVTAAMQFREQTGVTFRPKTAM